MKGKHEVVISGVAGLFPECEDFEELIAQLMDGIDLVTNDDRRWTPGEMGVPSSLGKIKNPEQFDISLFGIPRKLVEITDPNTRLSIMQAFRAVCDAGVNPSEISGSNTAVFMSSFTSETEDEYLTQNANLGTYGIIANSRAMQANRISFFLNLKGPSNVLDATWCGGAQAIQCAYDLISTGGANAAIIGSSSLIFKPQVSVHYQAMGKLSEDGATRSFSGDANGYARSEACVTMFLQRADTAKRSYGTIMGVHTLHRGLRSQRFSDFSSECFKQFLKDVYEKAGVDPKDIAYYEGAGVASKTVDAKELNTVAEFFLNERTKPLLIGSIKSNLGHCEGASNLVSLVKALIAADRGVIPPNLRYKSPNPDVPALISGKLKVVTEPTELEGDLLAVNDIGVSGGTLSHIIIRRHQKTKPKLECEDLQFTIPRLVLLSDRNKTNLQLSFKRLEDASFDEEFCTIVNSLNKEGLKGHLFRGYTVLNGNKNTHKQIESYSPSRNMERKPIWFVFSGMGSQWPMMGKALLRLPVFARTVYRCHEILSPLGIDLMDILTNKDTKVFDSILNCFVGIAAVQIGLVDILREVGIEPDGMIGHSVGELGCGYADGCLTLEQMILSAYARGKASLEATLIKGTMAAVGLGYREIKDQLPASVDVACHNSKTSCTLSGPNEDMEAYIKQLKSKGLFAKLVNVANIAYHSRYIKPAGPLLLNYLKPIIPDRTLRSSKWLSSSNPETQWDSDLARYSSAEYYTNNLLSAVLFEEASEKIPNSVIIIEIAPHGLLQAILKRSHPSGTHVSLTSRFDEDNLMFLLGALGKLYISGVSLNIEKLFPPVQYPVSRGTPALSPFVGWQNTENFKLEYIHRHDNESCWKDICIELRQEKFSSLSYHTIKGKVILPNSFYLIKLAKHFMRVRGKRNAKVEFEGLRFHNKAEVQPSEGCDISLQMQQGTGCFCVINGKNGFLMSSGKLSVVDSSKFHGYKCENSNFENHSSLEINGRDVNEFMKSYGLRLESKFNVIRKVVLGKNWLSAVVSWNGGLVEFLNGLLTLIGFFYTKLSNTLHLVEEIEGMIVDFATFHNLSQSDIKIYYDNDTRYLFCPGITILLAKTRGLGPNIHSGETFFEVHRFVPNVYGEVGSGQAAINICHQLIIENALIATDTWTKINVVCIGKQFFHDSLTTLSRTSNQIKLSTTPSENVLIDQDMALLRNEIVWIISAKPLSLKIIDKIKSCATRAFILMPKTGFSDQAKGNEIFGFTSSFERFSLLSFEWESCEKIVEKVYVRENYLTHLESKLMQASERNAIYKGVKELVYLIGQVDSQSMIMSIFDQTSDLPHQDLLRFQLGNSPVDELECDLKDIKVNIIWNKSSGTIRSFSVKSAGSALATSRGVSMYALSNVLPPTDTTTALGLNLRDVTGSLDEDELGVFDYANSNVMGLGKYDPLTKSFVEDDVFKWRVPSQWTPSEAATVPVLYSLAMYIFRYNNASAVDNSILINRGLLPLSQALISIALNENVQVYVTVYDDEEKKHILRMFPKLKIENIFYYSKSSFHIELLHNTEGRGVYKVVNTFKDEEMIKPCVDCVGVLGVYIQVSMAPLINKQKMGMLVFLNEVIAKGITVESLMNLSKETKLEIRNAVNKAIKCGQIFPFHKTSIAEDSTNTDASKYLKSTKLKLVVHLNGESIPKSSSLLNCSSNKTYVIVNDHKNKFTIWLDLASWLANRGARKIIIVLNNSSMTGVSSLRLQSLREKYSSLKINLLSADCLTSKATINKFFEDVNSTDHLGGVYILTPGNINLVEHINRGIEMTECKDCSFVCIGRGAERTCEKRNKKGLLSLCVRVGEDEIDSKLALDYMDDLIIHSDENPIVTVKSGSAKAAVSQVVERHHIPSTFRELYQLVLLTASKPSFKETATLSPRKVFEKEVSPIFVFPGLRIQKIRRITCKLFYPVLEVRIPKTEDLSKIATDLSAQMSSMSQYMFTLVAEGWGGILALKVAAKLESRGKIVRVILVDASPSKLKNLASELMRDRLSLISRYISIPYTVKSKLKESYSWDEMVGTIISESKLSLHEKQAVVCSLELLRMRLQGIIDITPPTYKMKRPCYLFEFNTDGKIEKSGLDEYFCSEAVVRDVTSETEEEAIERIIDEINSLALYELEDAAYPPKENFLKVSFIKGKTKLTV